MNVLASLLIIVVLLFMPTLSVALEQKYVERILKNAAWHQRMRTAYIWGKTDCSGTMHDIYFSAGIPVLRSTAYNMNKGLEGWKNIEILRDLAVPSDIVFWNVKEYKPSMGKLAKDHPHVGLKTSSKTIAHNSGGRKHFVEDPIDSPWGLKIEFFKRLLFKEK